MDSVDSQDLRVQHLEAPPTTKRIRQSRITTGANKKLRFSAEEDHTIHDISESEDDVENTTDQGIVVPIVPLYNLRQIFLDKKNRDLRDTVNFCQFLVTFLELNVSNEEVQGVEWPLEILLIWVAVHLSTKQVHSMRYLLQIRTLQALEKTQMNLDNTTAQILNILNMCVLDAENEEDDMPYTALRGWYKHIATPLAKLKKTNYMSLQMNSLSSLLDDPDRHTEVPLVDFLMLDTLGRQLRNLDSTPLSTPVQISDWLRYMGTTCTSSTCAPTQTRLAVVRGSRAVSSVGNTSRPVSINDEFTALTSAIPTGNSSVDISLQMDTSTRKLSAEVEMQEFIYDLKVYRRSDICKMEKNTWYKVRIINIKITT